MGKRMKKGTNERIRDGSVKKRGDDIRRRMMGNRLRMEGGEEVRGQRRVHHDL